jgi:radical SAM superfamily enzyme YgiQ (UPF0313 family)
VGKNAVLLALNAKYVHSSLSVWALAAGVAQYAREAHSINVVEATIHHSAEEIAEMVSAYSPDTVGISAYIWNAPMLPELLALLRSRLAGAVFVLGGPEASHNGAYWLAQGADYIINDERGFAEFLDGRAAAAPTDGWPDPYTPEHLASLKGRIAYIETSRGCPFRCAFCLSGGTGVQFLPIEEAKARIEKLTLTGARTVKFVDRTFNCNPERAYELFEFIIGLDSPCTYHFEAVPDLFDRHTLNLLAQAPRGRIQLEAGLQSFHRPALDAVFRKTDLKKAAACILEILRAGNIHLHIDLIAGLPGETFSRFCDSFHQAYALGAHNLQLGFLKLLHGSKLREQAEELGIEYSPAPPYEIIKSPWLNEGELAILKNAENALRHTTNKGRFLSSVKYALRVSGAEPFDIFRRLGEKFPNRGTALDLYAGQVYETLAGLPRVNPDELLDFMARDWFSMVKGKNTPHFLRGERKWEPVYLSDKKDPVTGLWAVEFL